MINLAPINWIRQKSAILDSKNSLNGDCETEISNTSLRTRFDSSREAINKLVPEVVDLLSWNSFDFFKTLLKLKITN